MKKSALAFLLSLLFVLLFTGCSDSTDWATGEIEINGTEITMPFSYKDLKQIKCKTADQYYNNISDDYVFNTGEEESQLVVLDSVKNGYVTLGCANAGKNPCTLANVSVYSVAASVLNEKTKLDICLPGDITWGATLEDIEDTYGEDGREEEYDSKTKVTKLTYKSDKESDKKKFGEYSLTLEVHDEKGLRKLKYSTVCPETSSGDETAAIEKRVVSEEPVSADLEKMPSDWKKPAVQFGDKVFGFPLTVADLRSVGFDFADKGKKEFFNPENIETRTMSSEQFGEITVDLVNLDENLHRPEDIWVDEMELDAAKLKNVSQISVTGGISFGSGESEVIKLFEDAPEAQISDYMENGEKVGNNYEYSLKDVATEQSLYCFAVDSSQGVQKITIKKHRSVFS